MNKPDNCPHCGVSLKGWEIPEKDQHHYNSDLLKPGDEGWITHGRREISVEVQGVYDGTLYYKCPDCDGTWHRFPKTARRLYDAAETAMGRERAKTP